MRRTITQAKHSQAMVVLGVFAVGFSIVELLILVKGAPLWDAITFLRDPNLPDRCSGPAKDEAFFYVKLWLTVAVTQSAIAGAICGWSILTIRNIWLTADSAGRVRRILIILLKFLLYGASLYFLSPKPLQQTTGCFQNQLRVSGSGLPFYVSVSFVMIALWAIVQRVDTIASDTKDVACLNDYVGLRSSMQMLTALSSVVLVCGVIQVGLRQRFIAAVAGYASASRADVMLEGLRYTVLLAAAYVPIHMRFNILGNDLLKTILGEVQSLGSEDVKKWADQKKTIEDLLSVNSYEWKTFGPGVAVIAPAVVGVLSKIIEGIVVPH